MKQCNGCKLSKPLSEFTKNKSTRDGLMRQCRECNTARAKRWHVENSDKANDRKRTARYRRHGITEEKFLEDSKNGCMICGAFEKLFIDHDHAHCPGVYGCSECYRGAICHRCNTGLGSFKDELDTLRKAMLYLELSNTRLVK